MPRLVLRIPLRTAALKVQGETQQAVPPPLGHRGQELACVAVRIPTSAVRVRPAIARFGIEIVESALHEPRIHEQPFDPVLAPGPPFIRRPAVDEESLSIDANACTPCRPRVRFGLAGREGRGGDHAEPLEECSSVHSRSFAQLSCRCGQ